MPIQIWRLVSIFFTAFVFGLSFREHGDLGEFALWTGALVGVVCIANWFVSKSAKLADRIYNAGLPVLYLAGYFGALPHRRAFLWALVCAFIQVEAAWAVFFWPVHFLTAAVVNFSFFYGIFVACSMHFEGPINRRSLYFQISLILIVLVVSLLSWPWSPIE